MHARFGISLLIVLGFGQLTFASGFEKSIMWGGKTAGVAGIASPDVQGSQSLYSNPAGLATDKVGQQDIALNLSPAWTQSKGPTTTANQTETSEKKLLVPPSLIYAKSINENFGVGVGVFASGGLYAHYSDVAVTGFKGTSDIKSEISFLEIAAGAGYKVSSRLKVGASYRVTQMKSNFNYIAVISSIPAVANVQNSDLKDTNYGGFRLGAQYKIDENTEIGLTYRSEVTFKAKGTQVTNLHTAASESDGAPKSVTMGTLLPSALNLAAVHKLNEAWRVFGELDYTQYSKVTNLALNTDTSSSSVPLQFKDQYEVRLAGEYSGLALPIRFGYIWNSAVTNKDYAQASLVPPSSFNTVTLGTGMPFGDWRADGAVEYIWGGASASKGGEANSTTLDGKYSASAYALHLGVSYTF